MFDFVSGLISMGFAISGVFFLRYWSRTRDILFAAFAIAMWMLAANQALLVFVRVPLEERSWLYLVRLGAFVLILCAIIAKNRRS